LIIVANGTEKFLRKALPRINPRHAKIKAISTSKKISQAACLKMAFKESSGKYIAAIGSYQQITEASYNILLDELKDDTDIISPWRKKRVDPNINQAQSKLFNYIARKITGSNINDLSCTVKLFRRDVFEQVELYGNMYRFFPIFAEKKGFKNKEVACEHYEEKGPIGFFGFSVYITRIIDLVTLYFNIHYSKKPMRFFSIAGLPFFIIGFIIFSLVMMQKFLFGIPIGGRSILLLSILSIVLGIQFSTIGLLGEIIAFTFGRSRKEYTIQKII
jgi:hypothetical protein